MTQPSIEQVKALIVAIEDFFGPDIFVPTTNTDNGKQAALNKAGVPLKALVDRHEAAEAFAKEIVAKVGDVNEDDGLQEFLDDTVHDLVSNEGSDINNDGAENQIMFLIEQMGIDEVRRQLNVWFDGRVAV